MNANCALSDKAPSLRAAWILIFLAGFILMISMGVRLTVGLFLHPVVEASSLCIAEVSLAFAIGQLMWGLFQPAFGMLSDRFGPMAALGLGAICMAAGNIGAIWADTMFWLIVTFGILSPAGGAAGSFGVAMGAISSRMPPALKEFSGGVINACGSAGQLLFSPLNQFFIMCWGYGSALMMMGIASLAIIPAAFAISRGRTASGGGKILHPDDGRTMGQTIRLALRTPGFLLLQLAFLTGGFHVAFLVTHLPGEIALWGLEPMVTGTTMGLIGLTNIVASLAAGWLGSRFKMKFILAALYALRSASIAIFLLGEPSEIAFYLLALGMGLTWISTVAPTASLIGKIFGLRYLATLFGITFLTHQIGGFVGAWIGGLIFEHTGSFEWMWRADMILAALAALIHLPIREERVNPLKRSA